ncbi:uncharacterized protein LOC130917729 [Corythoichthys intestinalis]|uniref:uncharacterized protein LOC130917729 n=1 Tax=Corythoichthys intestinalis TaxID=161448 RepID=UPI0025A4E285|nr:uncharacterized protein LOC130917729 [Corythoichthys intestinalis]
MDKYSRQMSAEDEHNRPKRSIQLPVYLKDYKVMRDSKEEESEDIDSSENGSSEEENIANCITDEQAAQPLSMQETAQTCNEVNMKGLEIQSPRGRRRESPGPRSLRHRESQSPHSRHRESPSPRSHRRESPSPRSHRRESQSPRGRRRESPGPRSLRHRESQSPYSRHRESPSPRSHRRESQSPRGRRRESPGPRSLRHCESQSPYSRHRESPSPRSHRRESQSPRGRRRESPGPRSLHRRESQSPRSHRHESQSPHIWRRESPSPRRRQSPSPRRRHRESPSPRRRHRESPSPRRRHQESLSPRERHRESPSPRLRHRESPSPRLRHRESPSPRRRHREPTSPRRRHREPTSPRRHHREPPSPRRRHRESPSPRLGHRESPSPRSTHHSESPSPRSRRRESQSPRQRFGESINSHYYFQRSHQRHNERRFHNYDYNYESGDPRNHTSTYPNERHSSHYHYDRPAGRYEPPRYSTQHEHAYRGPTPTIPYFVHEDPREFTRLKVALDNLLPRDATEQFKYQILLDHLKLEEALLLADSYCSSCYPYSDTMNALNEQYGQPHQLALKRIAEFMDEPNIRSGDTKAFRKFALKVRALVGMLFQLGDLGQTELKCGSHVSRILTKLPHHLRADFKRHVNPLRTPIPTLLHLSDWLEYEVRVHEDILQFSNKSSRDRPFTRKEQPRETQPKGSFVFHSSELKQAEMRPSKHESKENTKEPTKFCPFCNTTQHFLNQCTNFKILTKDQIDNWIRSNKRCWRCGREHLSSQCTLKARCKKCKGKHLEVLHENNAIQDHSPTTSIPVGNDNTGIMCSTVETLYVDKPTSSNKVLLKVIRVILKNGNTALDTYAVLDDGSERTILLHEAFQALGLHESPEDLHLRTVRQDVCIVHGSSVSFTLSSATNPSQNYEIRNAFTAKKLALGSHSYPIDTLRRKYLHLKDLPIPAIDQAQPLLLIGSDHQHLILPIEPVRLGPPDGPAAVKTILGWTLQGPSRHLNSAFPSAHCFFTSGHLPQADLFTHVERLWQLDVLPYRSEKAVTRSREDSEALKTLAERTTRVEVNGVQRYATPLIWKKNLPQLQAPKEAVLGLLRSTEKRLAKDTMKIVAYKEEINKLLNSGYIKKLLPTEVDSSPGWYIPHHMVTHNAKNRIVFNCSFKYKGLSLNDHLLPGPTLSSSLLGVLLRFKENKVAISSDVKGMFHQVRLLPEDQSYLRFLWRNTTNEAPEVYQWLVLPFGTVSSPCCATFALQTHVINNSESNEDVRTAVTRCFYVDNWLQSLPSVQQAQSLANKLRRILEEGGFELRQWATSHPEVIKHLPLECTSESTKLWFTQNSHDPQELALGLMWHCRSDTLCYKPAPSIREQPTMRVIYKVLASQFDPLGYISPYITRAKILVQKLWTKKREWDDPNLPEDLLKAWTSWENELPQLTEISFPRCYTESTSHHSTCTRTVHIFSDASEQAYGSVSYLRTTHQDNVQVSFLAARSRVAPKKQLSMPRLELCGALSGAQLAAMLKRELTLEINEYIYWTDSTTVLTWLQSESCNYKVFVGTRIAEIQELTDPMAWRYVNSQNNPADDITRGKTLAYFKNHNHWNKGPDFLKQHHSKWPVKPVILNNDIPEEMRKSVFCGQISNCTAHLLPDPQQFGHFQELLETIARSLHGAANKDYSPSAEDYRQAELTILRKAQCDSFPIEVEHLKAGRAVRPDSRLLKLSPEWDQEMELIRVGGRLRHCNLTTDSLHPVVLDPAHHITKLILKTYDQQLRHPGAERVFAEIRRRYWILRGRQAVRKLQHECPECQKWRAKPETPKMADLPPARLRLHHPAFYSTGMDCFGPLEVKVGRRTEKRWGILYKCLTTRAVYIDLLTSLDVDAFLMSLRRLIARRGKPHEVYSDQGTNFKGGNAELQQTFNELAPLLKSQLSSQQIDFHFNPPKAPHFGGVWEREIRSVKSALRTTLGVQVVPEEVRRTVLVEIEGILNSKPLGYVSSDIADPDPITPNTLLMGRHDSALPLVVYPKSDLSSRKRWRHSQILSDQFWRCFTQNYLPTLQTRNKWTEDKDDLKVGTVVMVADPQSPRSLWPVGTVKTIMPGRDNKVRVAEVQVKDKLFVRPVARLIRLPAFPQDEDT